MFLVSQQMSELVKHFNIWIFSDTINLINVKLCMMVLHIERYLFITLSVTLTVYQGHVSIKQFNWKFYVLIIRLVWLIWNFVGLLSTSSRSWIYHYFWLLHTFKRNNWSVSGVDKKKFHWLFHEHCQARFFKLCIIITLLGVYQFILGLMTLILFQGHKCVRIINCKSFFNSCLL